MVTSSGSPPDWRVNAAGRGKVTGAWLSVWRSRELIGFFALRDIRVLYKQAALGVLWVLLQPVATVVIFTLVFSRLANIDSQGIPYPLFALVGMVVWSYFSAATVRGSDVLVSNPQLVTKVSFPRIAAPAAAMLPPLVDMAVSLALVAVLFVYYGVSPTWRVLAAPACILLVVLAAFGTTLWLSALNVRYRDVQHAVGPLMQLWLFASPVAYPASLFEGWHALVYALNPMAGLLGIARWSLLGTPLPGWPAVVSLITLLAVLGTGLLYFTHAERLFADVI
jgi:ABC-type polysaccharide/polyol phosphate export permease